VEELKMVPDLFAVCLLVLGLGLVLGYLLAMPRVKVLETALHSERENWLARESKLAQAHSLAMLKVKDLESTQLDLDSDLSRESERQWVEKSQWKLG
jgi:hypothetical protein